MKVKEPDELLSLSNRTRNLLRRNGVFTVKQLEELEESRGICTLRGAGKHIEREVQDFLAVRGWTTEECYFFSKKRTICCVYIGFLGKS
jgi:hypothetical protein